jgi:hypothetical protein
VKSALAVAALALLGAQSAGAASLRAPLGTPEVKWLWTSTTSGYTGKTFRVLDLDGDGVDDLLLSACNGHCWTVVSHAGAGLQATATDWPRDGSITILDATGGSVATGASVVAVRDFSSEIEVYALRPVPELVRTIPVPAIDELQDVRIADLDGDGRPEILVADAFDLRVYDLATGDLEQTAHGFGGGQIEVGQLDDDPQLEVVVLSGLWGAAWVLDGVGLDPQGGSPSGFGPALALADLDGDGRAEILTWDEYPPDVRAFDPRTGTWLYDRGIADLEASSIRQVFAVDADGDGDREAAVIDSSSGAVELLDGVTGDPAGGYVLDSDFSDVAAGDVTGDGRDEVLLSQDSVGVLRADTGVRIETWVSGYWELPGVGADDLDDDGVPDLLVATRYGAAVPDASGAGELLQLRGRDGWFERSRLPGFPGPPGVAQIDAAVVLRPASGQAAELCAASGPDLRCLDGRTGAETWHTGVDPGHRILDLAVGDLHGDGSREIVLSEIDDQAWDVAVRALDGTTGAELWSTPRFPFGNGGDHLLIGDVDRDGSAEVVLAGRLLEGFVVIDGSSGAVEGMPTTVQLEDLTLGDVDGDGWPDLVASDTYGQVGIVDATTGAWLQDLLTVAEPIRSLAVGDFVGGPGGELAVLTQDTTRIFDPVTQQALWSSPQANYSWSSAELAVADVDGDGREDLVIRGWPWGLAVVGEPYAGNDIFRDGFELGSTVAWSRAR